MSYFEYVFGFFAAKAKTDVTLRMSARVRKMASSFLVFFNENPPYKHTKSLIIIIAPEC